MMTIMIIMTTYLMSFVVCQNQFFHVRSAPHGFDKNKMLDLWLFRRAFFFLFLFFPQIFTRAAHVQGLMKKLQWERAMEIFESMKYHGAKPDLITFNSLMSGLVRSNRPEL